MLVNHGTSSMAGPTALPGGALLPDGGSSTSSVVVDRAPGCLELVVDDTTSWEGESLGQLAAQGELMAYEHRGFWQPMDTLRDKNHLENLWQSGKAPWKVWK